MVESEGSNNRRSLGTFYHLPFTIYHPSTRLAAVLARRSLFAAAHLRCISVARRAATEDPADHDADQQDAGDEDEVRGRHPFDHVRPLASTRRDTSAISRSTVPSRRQIENR